MKNKNNNMIKEKDNAMLTDEVYRSIINYMTPLSNDRLLLDDYEVDENLYNYGLFTYIKNSTGLRIDRWELYVRLELLRAWYEDREEYETCAKITNLLSQYFDAP